MKQHIGSEYPGIALHENLKNGKCSGRIILTTDSLRFESEQGSVELPLNDLIIKRGGSSGHLVTFEHHSRPGWMIYTEKKGILKTIKRLSNPYSADKRDISQQVAKIRKTNAGIRAAILSMILVSAAIIFGLYLLRNPVNKAIAKNIPAEWEISLGESVFENYKQGRHLVEDADILSTLGTVTTPLLNTIPNRRYEFHLHIIEDPSINAFALPGGYVVLHTGLIAAVESPEELLGVIAHEISHVTLQHGIRKILDSLGLVLIIKAFMGDPSGMWAQVLENGAFLLGQKFSREFEREADETGFSYLTAAHIDPRGMIGFFQRLREESEKAGTLALEETLNFLSTHPDPGSRIDYLNRKWEQLAEKSGFLNLDADFLAFKNIIKERIPAAEK